FEMRKIRKLLALVLVRDDPRVGGHIGDRILPRDKGPVRQALVEDSVETIGFVHITFDRIAELLGRVLFEMMVLAGHWAKAANLPEKPFERRDPPAQIPWQKFTRLFGKIEEDGARFENRHRGATVAGILINDRWNAIIGRNRQKFRLELVPSAEVDRMDRVGKSRLFEEQSDLVPVRGGPIKQVDHREGLSARRSALHECC